MKKHNFLFAIACVFSAGLLTYGYTFFNHVYNNDGLLRILENEASVRGSLITGRWFYYPLSHLYFEVVRLPLFHGLVSLAQLCICVVLIWRLFDLHSLTARILSGAMFITLPVFIHFFYYLGDSEVYSAGMVMTLSSLFFFRKDTLMGYAGALILIAAALGCYPALFSFISCAYMLYTLNRFTTGQALKENIILLAKVSLICTLGLVLYYGMTHGLLSLTGLRLIDYKNSNEITSGELLRRFPQQAVHTFFLLIRSVTMSNPWYQLVFAGSLLGMVLLIRLRHSHPAVAMIYGAVLITGTLISSLAAYLITYERFLYPGFTFGLIVLSSMLVTYPLGTFRRLYRILFIAVALICIVANIRDVHTIALKYQWRMDGGQRIVSQIGHDLLKHPAFDKEKTRVAFVGELAENDNYHLFDPLEDVKSINGLGKTLVGFSANNSSEHLANQLLLQGLRIRIAPMDSMEAYLHHTQQQQAPEYPEEGSIFEYGEVLIVNLGTSLNQ